MGACKSAPKNEGERTQDYTPADNSAPVEITSMSSRPPPVPASADEETVHDHAAKESELQWVNYMITVMWPYMRQAMIKKSSEKFQERMHEELRKHKEVQIDTLTLDFDPGLHPPRITGLLVYQRTQQERNGLQVDVDFFWRPDTDFRMMMSIHGHAKGFPINAENVGVSGMEVSGTMSVLMAPLLDIEPCIGTGQAFFLDTPQINLKVVGFKKLGPIGGVLTGVMEGVVKNILAEGYILPHRFVQKIRKDLPLETMVTMKSPLPLGLLVFEVIEGRNLPAADTSFTGKKSSDPFVEIALGYGKYRSSTAENTLNPKWKDPRGHLFVYNVAQLVRISVHDDDALGADILGTVVGYNVFLLMQEQYVNKDGVWYNLVDKQNNPAGQVKIKVKYYDIADIADLKAPPSVPQGAPPYLLTVKLLGLEAEDRGDLRNTFAKVELMHPEVDGAKKVDHEEHHANRLMAGFEAGMSWAKQKVKTVTGIEVGFGAREDGVPSFRKSGKAVLWGSQKQLEDSEHHVIPPMAIRAMEKLVIRERWEIKKVAAMFQLDEEVVRTAVEMRGNFEVVWHEALHFLQPPENPFLGKVKIAVQAPAGNQVRGADDHGFLGEFEIDLAEEAVATATTSTNSANGQGRDGFNAFEKDSTPWKRRIRRMLYRPKGKSQGKDAAPDVFASKDNAPKWEEKPGEECTGVLIELMVELRTLVEEHCVLEKGQIIRDKKSLEKATTSCGVKMIPE